MKQKLLIPLFTIVFFITIILCLESCATREYTIEYRLQSPVVLVDKYKFLNRYELFLMDTSGVYIIDGHSTYIKFIYNKYTEGDTIQCNNLKLYKW